MSAALNERPVAKDNLSGTSQVHQSEKQDGFKSAKGAGKGSKAAKGSSSTEAAQVVAPAVAQGAAPTPEAHDLLVPMDRLVLSGANVRTVVAADGIVELAALIYSQGLLQRLLIVPHGEGAFAVVAGGRRLRAMQLLVSDGRWPGSEPIECRLFPDKHAVELSLAENSGREDMHPADQMEAFRTLVEQGKTVAQVAGRFGVSVLTVERRLKLARLAPRFLAMYRAEEIEPDQLMALTLTEDHAAQEAVWDGLPAYDRDAHSLRRVMTAQSSAAGSRLAVFVGVAEYQARGGAVRRDLFAEEGDGAYLEDPVLLQTLAMEKLRVLGEEVRAEGWGWVECLTEGDSLALRQFVREEQTEREPAEEEKVVLDALRAEYDAVQAAWGQQAGPDDQDDQEFEATEARLSAVEADVHERLEAAEDKLLCWHPEQMARSGALLRIDYQGKVIVDRGLVRPEDVKARRGGSGESENSDPGDGSASTRAASDAGAPSRKKRGQLSEKLMRDLTSHRTAALQAALVLNPQVALVALVHRLAESVFELYGRGNDVLKIHLTQTSDFALAQAATGYENSPAGTLLGRAASEWGDRLPGTSEALFHWLLTQERDTLLELLAYCTARSFDAIGARERRHDQSDAIARALGMDMADWWVPTAENYLSQVSKAKAREAVAEATGKDPAKELEGLKKPSAVAWCADRMEGTRWLPAPLRPLAVPGASVQDDEEQVTNV